jgi:hypothetical protein
VYSNKLKTSEVENDLDEKISYKCVYDYEVKKIINEGIVENVALDIDISSVPELVDFKTVDDNKNIEDDDTSENEEISGDNIKNLADEKHS